jgi:hypothetical protein
MGQLEATPASSCHVLSTLWSRACLPSGTCERVESNGARSFDRPFDMLWTQLRTIEAGA